MRSFLITIIIATIVIGLAIVIHKPTQTFEGTVTGSVKDNLIVEFVIPASASELIGLEPGDPYVIEGVHK